MRRARSSPASVRKPRGSRSLTAFPAPKPPVMVVILRAIGKHESRALVQGSLGRRKPHHQRSSTSPGISVLACRARLPHRPHPIRRVRKVRRSRTRLPFRRSVSSRPLRRWLLSSEPLSRPRMNLRRKNPPRGRIPRRRRGRNNFRAQYVDISGTPRGLGVQRNIAIVPSESLRFTRHNYLKSSPKKRLRGRFANRHRSIGAHCMVEGFLTLLHIGIRQCVGVTLPIVLRIRAQRHDKPRKKRPPRKKKT